MEQLRTQGMEQLKELGKAIRAHEENEQAYAKKLGLMILPDLANDVIFNELNGEIPEGLTGDLYLELPFELSIQVEDAETKEELTETLVMLECLIQFWNRVVQFEHERLNQF